MCIYYSLLYVLLSIYYIYCVYILFIITVTDSCNFNKVLKFCSKYNRNVKKL